MGIFEKRRFRKLMIYIMEFNLEDPKTWGGIDPKQNTAEDLYNKFGVDKNTIDVTGHALALHRNDAYVFLHILYIFFGNIVSSSLDMYM